MSVKKWVCKHKIPSNKKYFQILGDYFFGICRFAGMARSEAQDLRLALLQALENVRVHAYDNQDGRPIQVEFHRTSKLIQIKIRDYGKRVRPAEIQAGDLNEFREGGLGVLLMEKVMDRVQYLTFLKKGTLLIMEKRLG